MADVILLNSGKAVTVMGMRDFLELVDTHMGWDARRWLEDWIADQDETEYAADLENEIKALGDRKKAVMAELREQSETIARLIRGQSIDRSALSAAAGRIGAVTWRELNV